MASRLGVLQLTIVLALINLFNYLDRYVVAALLPIIQQEFSLTLAQSSLVVSVFVIGYAVSAPLAGVCGARFNRVRFAQIGVVIFSVATFACGLATGFWALVLARICIGVGEGIFSAVVPGYIRDQIEYSEGKTATSSQVARALAIFMAAMPVGAACGYVVGGYFSDLARWHYAFFFAGGASALLSILLSRCSDHVASTVRSVDSGMRQVLIRTWQLLKTTPVLVRLLAGYVLHTAAIQAIAVFVASYAQTLGFSGEQAGSYFGLILVVTGFAGTLLGSRAFGRWYGDAAISTYLCQVTLVTALLVSTTFLVPAGWFFVMAALAELGAFAVMAPLNARIVHYSPTDLAAAVQGITIVAINVLGALLGPSIVGLLADATSLKLAMQCSALWLILASVVWGYSARSAKK